MYYRQSTKRKASELNITGYVKNEADGTVLIVASGSATQLDELINWCRQGPPAAIVKDIMIKEIPFGSFDRFTTRH